MTETPQQERANPEPDPNRLNTENLRNYTQLRRTTYDRKIAGVAGGLARHLNIDPVIVRVVLVVLIFFGGAGLLLYGAAWLLVPDDSGRPATWHTSDSTRNTLLIISAVFAGLLLVGDSWGGFGFPWPLAILALIVFGVLMSRDNAPRESTEGGAWVGAQNQAPTPVDQPYHYAGNQYGWVPVTASTPPPKSRKGGPILFGITIAFIAAGIGALGLYDSLADNNVSDAAYPAVSLAIIGGMLVVGAFFGRPGGLIFLGLLASIGLLGASIADPRFDGDREQRFTPTSITQVEDSYHVPAGQIILDLSRLSEPGQLDGRTIHLDANAGEILVILPLDGLSADLNGDIQFGGAITVNNNEDGGWGYSRNAIVGDPTDPRVTLDIDVKFGHIEVRQEAA
ncbi:MAG TPA: PspC domain-containing protein [Nocardioidaceae bacterium]|nr:PspC domain-containing protein [Nocardioidaceae bacterium]